MSEDLAIFSTPLETGSKQAILPHNEKGIWTPFIIMGPGVKKGYAIKDPIRHVDQYPTLIHLLGLDIPDFVDGKTLKEILE